MTDRQHLQEREQFALKLSIAGTLLMAGLGFGFAKLTNSPLVSVDAKGWMIDGILSFAICLGFLAMYLMKDSPIAKYLVYADSSLVVLLVIISLPIPYRILKENLREVLIMAPPRATAEAIEKHLTEAARAFEFKGQVVRIQKYGRATYLNVHMVLDKDYSIDTINTLDNIRAQLDAKMKVYDPQMVMDVVFIGDIKWAGIWAETQ